MLTFKLASRIGARPHSTSWGMSMAGWKKLDIFMRAETAEPGSEKWGKSVDDSLFM